MGKKERTRGEIIQDLLLVTLEERQASKTKIMQRAYLNQKSFQKYFHFLLGNGYLTTCGLPVKKYMVTNKGREMLDWVRQVNQLLNQMICLEESQDDLSGTF